MFDEYFTFLNLDSFLIVTLVLLLVLYWYRKPRQFPPGPRGFPLVGIVPFLGRFPELVFQKWSKKYGPIFSVRMGREDVVVLNNYESIQLAFGKKHEEFSGRAPIEFLESISKGMGITTVDYTETYKAQRKFGLLTLRGMGVGKRSMEERVAEEVAYLNEAIRSNNEKPFDINVSLKTAVSNNICSVLFGKRFEYDDPVFTELMKRFDQGLNSQEIFSLTRILMNTPSLRFVPPFKHRFKLLTGHVMAAMGLHKEIINEHKQTLDPNNIRDFTDAFLLEIERKSHPSFKEEQLPHFIRDLFIAGTEPTASTIRWGILLLLHYPQVQAKLREEILEVLGADGKFSMTIRETDLPYTCCFIQELTRFRPVATLGVFHRTTTDAEIEGFYIPKHTKVISNLWAANHDPNHWKDPDAFKPERHMDENGRFLKSHRIIPFSVGPRHCLGETLARMELFVFLVSMVQKFEFLPDPNAPTLPPLNDGIKGLAYIPFPFKLVAKEV